MKRINSIDFVRGFVMIIMALDHVRDMLHTEAVDHSPTDLTTTTPAVFFTRWITHLCAPSFVFLAGLSAYLAYQASTDKAASRRFFIKRGLFLLLMEFTLVNFGLFFDVHFSLFLFEVIAAIGIGFIALGWLCKLPLKVIAAIGLGILLLHDLMILVPMTSKSVMVTILTPLFGPVVYPLTQQTTLIIGYPPVPWLGIMLLGYAVGRWFTMANPVRKKWLLSTGVIAIASFILLRFINIYGDPFPWHAQKNSFYTFLSYMNVNKYPPSLCFCLITLGITCLLLALAEFFQEKLPPMVIQYGKAPLFYFVVHLYVIHVITLLLLLSQGVSWSHMDFAGGRFGRPKGVQTGLPLWGVYGVWMAVVLLLYKPVVWFTRYKAAHKTGWLKYV